MSDRCMAFLLGDSRDLSDFENCYGSEDWLSHDGPIDLADGELACGCSACETRRATQSSGSSTGTARFGSGSPGPTSSGDDEAAYRALCELDGYEPPPREPEPKDDLVIQLENLAALERIASTSPEFYDRPREFSERDLNQLYAELASYDGGAAPSLESR